MNTSRRTNQATENLPPELQALIAGFCSFDTLRSLAAVSETFQVVSEQRLYSSIAVRPYDRKEAVLETLAASATRASYVKSLTIDCHYLEPSLVSDFIQALPHMEGLRDLRFRLGTSARKDDIATLNGILCGGCLRLNTLFVDGRFDLRTIVEAQKSLTFLGVYEGAAANEDHSLAPLSSLRNRSLPVVGLSSMGNTRGYGRITLFPGLLDLEQARTLDHQIRRYFRAESSPGSNPERVTTVVVCLHAAPDQEMFETFMKSASRAFPNITELELKAECGLLEGWRLGPVDALPGSRVRVWNCDPCKGKDLEPGELFRGSKARFSRWMQEYYEE